MQPFNHCMAIYSRGNKNKGNLHGNSEELTPWLMHGSSGFFELVYSFFETKIYARGKRS